MSAPLGAAPERIWLAVEAVDMRLGIDGLEPLAKLPGASCCAAAFALRERFLLRAKPVRLSG
jgi:hypothetical protein